MSQQQTTASQTETIRAAILAFDWGNYRLDEVDEAEPDYAADLAAEIATALGIDEVA
jgi:hypothetical protein